MTDRARELPLLDAMAHDAAALEALLETILNPAAAQKSRVMDAMRYSVLGGGKRIRPFLTLQCARLFGVSDDHAIRVGAAIELVHCYSLIHDDLPAMDDDDLRRGKPSCHIAFDQATAILAGDALLTLAFEVLADPKTHPNAEIRCDLSAGLASAAGSQGMVGGQMLDLLAECREKNVGLVNEIQRLKTGALITYACEAGAILGRASKEQRDAIIQYGSSLGLAFQMKDDLLDTLGGTTDLGKVTQKDADAGKATFVALLGIDEALKKTHSLSKQAIRYLEVFGSDAEQLAALARFTVDRRF
ncbi:MAG: farnesyl diphosphate synthase [Rhodospirillaceae bacterium]